VFVFGSKAAQLFGIILRVVENMETTSEKTLTGHNSLAAASSQGLPLDRKLYLLLCVVALGYAFLAGLRTLTQYDLGWQLATGRWIVQHHQIPATDVLSYTAQGQPWIYPVGSALLFYALFLLGGYSLLSWLGAMVCAGTVAILLRRGSLISAGLAILAVPLIAVHTSPRADMFTLLLLATFLSLIWQQHECGRACLWLLPALMIAWVNLHLGLAAGLALLGGYVLLECFEMAWPERRRAARHRLRSSWPWLVATFAATLVNPWGWRVYSQMLGFMAPMTTQSAAISIAEWAPANLNWTSVLAGLSPRNPDSFLFLLLVAAFAIPLAFLRRQPGAAVLLGGAAFLGIRHVRFQALFSVVLVVIGGAVLTSAWSSWQNAIRDSRIKVILKVGLCCLAVVFTCAWSADVISGRTYLMDTNLASFGTGLSWWFPEGAASFIERENIPGQIFNSYDEGGYIAWRLGPQRRDYVDGRGDPFGPELVRRSSDLMGSLPASAAWQNEAEQYGIYAILAPLGRYDALQFFPVLRQFCASETWRPVYLDEVSAVFVRRAPETEGLIQRTQVDCGTAPLPAVSPARSGSKAFNQWANAASVLSALGRKSEAFTATTNALAIFPDSAYVHFLRGNLFAETGNMRAAESEYLLAAALTPKAPVWTALAEMYERDGRLGEAIAAWEHVADLASDRYSSLLSIGYDYLGEQRPQEALKAFDRALNVAPAGIEQNKSFYANLAHGRAMAWIGLRNSGQAIVFEEDVVRLAPDRSDDWLELAQLYESEGRIEDAQRARANAAKLGEGQVRSNLR
jgi:tetratricopeptide (TPR) repeat protein